MALFMLDILTGITLSWATIAVAGSLAVAAIIALIYAISGIIGNAGLRAWSKINLFEVAFSLILIFVFVAIVGIISQINFGSLLSSFSAPSCKTYSDIFQLAVCDLSYFNQQIVYVGYIQYVTLLALSASVTYPMQASFGLITLKAEPSLIPDTFNSIVIIYFDIFYSEYLLNKALIFLLVVSPLLFGVLMALGLLSRIFPITRSFGGSMIALGIGLGLLMPLLISMGYGFIDASIQNSLNRIASSESASITFITEQPYSELAKWLGFEITTPTSAQNAIIGAMLYIGYVLAGMLLMPILVFTLVDVFVTDFSSVIGEQISFMSLLANLI